MKTFSPKAIAAGGPLSPVCPGPASKGDFCWAVSPLRTEITRPTPHHVPAVIHTSHFELLSWITFYLLWKEHSYLVESAFFPRNSQRVEKVNLSVSLVSSFCYFFGVMM